MEEGKFIGHNNREIFYRKWEIEDPKAFVQIAHGMAEHSLRYDRFAKELNKNGYSVFANDHRGHGYTANPEYGTGYFEGGDFFKETVADLKIFNDKIKKEGGDKPIILLGHSMGSFLCRALLLKSPSAKGVVLSGTAGDPGFLGSVGIFLAGIIRFFFGKKSRSTLLSIMTFGQYNAAFKPSRTNFDWLSRDEKEVDKYVDDPMCGAIFTSNFFHSLVSGIKSINSSSYFNNVPKDIPILFSSGDLDPVGEKAKGVKSAYAAYENAGAKSLDIKLYSDARHELLNETNKENVMKDWIDWMDKLI